MGRPTGRKVYDAVTVIDDASGFSGHADELFVPRDETELIGIVRAASRDGVPLTVIGARTGITGGCVPAGGWAVSLEKLNEIEVRPGFARAGAGVLLRDLHAAAARTRQFYPPDPTETGAALGGTIGTNASGARSFRYGATRRHILRLRVVLADGRVLDVRRGDKVDFPVPELPIPQTTKHAAGYALRPEMDWIDLVTGSEGTLGIVTEAEVRLLPQPEALLAGVVFFEEDANALAAVDEWRPLPGLRMLEYFDRPSLELLRAPFPEIPVNAGAALLFEQESGEPEAWLERLDSAGALAEASWFAAGESDRERFRRFRHALPEMVNTIVRRNGFTKIHSDYAVPLAASREMLAFYRARLEESFPRAFVIFGHIGDAHVHVNILPESQDAASRGRELMIDFARRAVALGGTVSAEHGLGKRRTRLLELQFTPAEIEAMKQVKRRLDPQWLLGRGTLFPCDTV